MSKFVSCVSALVVFASLAGCGSSSSELPPSKDTQKLDEQSEKAKADQIEMMKKKGSDRGGEAPQ